MLDGSRMVGLLGVPIGVGISWSNRLVGAEDSMGSCPIGAGGHCRFIQLELEFPCSDI
jgi:hypothetical protein